MCAEDRQRCFLDSSLPSLPELRFSMIHNGKEYRNSILSGKVVTGLREALEDRYKYSTTWKLLFSTFEDGFSYRTFLESFEEDGWPFVLACKTREGELLGAFFEDRIRISRAVYGKPSTFLFTTAKNKAVQPEDISTDNELMIFTMSKNKEANIYCCPDFLAFGCSGEKFGLLINKSLLDGETYPIETFGNHPLASKSHFRISYIELWLIQI
ncbi:oxidation resistance protein [Encephalitozoon romaleae SJ-2008]|uniref:Oxidation resistance protein 1 n=1 Tax=Encephalitozoon romaleae (strain SJ-2008) TaxID=1178016 RepID=I7AF75_ENCRO|nr:oxidation resistance protein [Encephalitozoon romaleae SJ-2008]AFN83340.1 oxidation resistance protein [Encephalitozoon romaleae SJ-2008]